MTMTCDIQSFGLCGKCSNISNASCLPKSPRQTAQTPIRLLLIRVFSVRYSDEHYARMEKVLTSFFLVDGGTEDPNTTISRPSSARQLK